MKIVALRIGKVSSVNLENGTIEVTYPENSNVVTDNLPYLAYNGEYKMPEIGSDIIVAFPELSAEKGVVLGNYWNEGNKPAGFGKDYRKDFSKSCYIEIENDKLTIHAPEIEIVTNTGILNVKELLGGK